MYASVVILHGMFAITSCARGSEAPRDTPPPVVECVTAASSATPDATALTELRTAAEASPLFRAVRARGAVTSCEVSAKGSLLTLNFRFADKTAFTMSRDPQIEYASQDLALAEPLTDDASALLQRSERETFGADGCGIDWSAGHTERSADGVSSDRVFRGDVCQCQARIRSDKTGRVIGLLLRSTC